MLLESRLLEEAAGALDDAKRSHPEDPAGIHFDAELLRRKGCFDEAVPVYRRALLACPQRADSWAGLGDCHARLGDAEEAFISYRTALSIEPNRADVLNELGMVSLSLGNRSAAAESFEQAVNVDPRNAEAWNNFGLVAASRGNFEDARRSFHRAAHLRPAFYTALCNLGLACRDLGRLDEAKQALGRATESAPDRAAAWVTLSSVLQDEGRLEDARPAMERAVAVAPRDPVVLTAMGVLMLRLGDSDGAARALDGALRVTPGDAEALLAKSHLDLSLGRYAEGWDGYEARLRASQSPRRRFPFREWDGTEPAGRSILVYAEQGIGDTVMFASCLGDLIARAGRCSMHCEDRLWPLLNRSFPGLSRYVQGDEGSVDGYAAIGSLPRLYRQRERDFPAHEGYLRADPRQVAAARAALPATAGSLRVGIAWRGGLRGTGRAVRSLALADLAPLLATKGVDWVNLQHGDVTAEIAATEAASGVRVHCLAGIEDDIDALAAGIAAVDLVITVCSSVVHLAGALGRKAWVLTPHAPAWRYRLHGDSMPWYPSVRLYRQAHPGAWEPVLQAVGRDLVALVEARR